MFNYEFVMGTDFAVNIDVPDLSALGIDLTQATEVEYTIKGSGITKSLTGGDITITSASQFRVSLDASDSFRAGRHSHQARVTAGGKRRGIVFDSIVSIVPSYFV